MHSVSPSRMTSRLATRQSVRAPGVRVCQSLGVRVHNSVMVHAPMSSVMLPTCGTPSTASTVRRNASHDGGSTTRCVIRDASPALYTRTDRSGALAAAVGGGLGLADAIASQN